MTKNIFYKIKILLFTTLLMTMSCNNNSISKKDQSEMKHFVNDEMVLTNFYDTTNIDQHVKDIIIWVSLLQQRNDHARAIIELQDIQKFDSSYVIDYSIAKSYFELSKNENSIKYSLKCLQKKSDFIPALELLTSNYIQTMQLDKAITTAEFICKIDDSQERNLYLASLYEFKDPTKSIRIYEKYYDQIDNPNILERLAIIYQSNNQKSKYLDVKKKILNLNPSDMFSFGALLDSYLNYREVNQAIQLIEDTKNNFNDTVYIQAVTMVGQYFLYYRDSSEINKIENFINSLNIDRDFENRIDFLRVYLYDKIEKVDISEKILKEILTTNSSKPDKVIDVVLAYFTIKKYDDAMQLLNSYESKYPSEWKFPYYTGVGYSLQLKENDAILPLKRALNIDSNNVEVLVQLANSYDQLKNKSEAENIYRKALLIEPQNPLLNNNFAYLLSEKTENLEEALKLSSHAISLDSNNYAYLDTYGWILHKMGNSEESLKYLHFASELNYNSAEILEHLAEVYLFLGKRSEALYYYKKAFEIDSKRLYLSEKILNLENK